MLLARAQEVRDSTVASLKTVLQKEEVVATPPPAKRKRGVEQTVENGDNSELFVK